jgi:hypothetical protein
MNELKRSKLFRSVLYIHLGDEFMSPVTSKSPSTLVLCELPSGATDIISYQACISGGGEVLEKVFVPVQEIPDLKDRILVYQTATGEQRVGSVKQSLEEKGTLLGILEATSFGNRISQMTEEDKTKILGKRLEDIKDYI